MNLIITEFKKIKRYSILIIGFIGVTFSPIIAILQNNLMTVEAGAIKDYTFRNLLDSTIWNNMAIFFPMLIALIGGYLINREYVDDTLKNVLSIPISMRRIIFGKLCTLGIISILLGIYCFLVTLAVGKLFAPLNLTFTEAAIGGLQIVGMSVCLFITEMPIVAWCAKKQDAFKVGALLSFVLGYLSIFLKSSFLRNIYPYSAGLSVIQFDASGFVSDATGNYASTQSTAFGFGILVVLLIVTFIIVITTPNYKMERKKMSETKKRKMGARKNVKI